MGEMKTARGKRGMQGWEHTDHVKDVENKWNRGMKDILTDAKSGEENIGMKGIGKKGYAHIKDRMRNGEEEM